MPTEIPSSDGTNQRPTNPKRRATAKPRAGIQRKTEAEREEYARKEAERVKEREAKDATSSTKPPAGRGRGVGRGGRGGAIVSKNDRTTASVSSGIFGAGPAQRVQHSKALDLGTSEALDDKEKKNTEATSQAAPTTVVDAEVSETRKSGTGRGRAVKTQEAIDEPIQMEDDVDEQPRRDIERIWISSEDDEEEDDIISHKKGKQRRISKGSKLFSGLRPVRAARDFIPARDANTVNAAAKQAAVEDNNAIEIDSDEMQVEEAGSGVRKDLPSRLESNKRSTKKLDSKTKDHRALNETVEERAERLRLQDDINNLKEAFSNKSDTNEDTNARDEAVSGRHEHEKMFLFQLPPLVPHLLNLSTSNSQNEEMVDTDQVQVKIEDANAAAAAATAVASTAEVAPKEAEQGKTISKSVPAIYTADAEFQQRLPEGFVGKLRIHQSGKVTLDWGGTDMEVRYGTEVDFLQDVICVEEPASERIELDGNSMPELGKSYAIGQIDRKMVLVPDWSRLYA